MRDFNEYGDEMDLIRQSLNELVNMGLVEIVGITPSGEWLYGTTELGNKFASQPSFIEAMEALEDELDDED